MLDERLIRIEISQPAPASGNSGNGRKKKGDGVDDFVRKILNPVDTIGEAISEKSQMGGMVFTQSVNLIISSAENELNRYQTLREDYMGQQGVQNATVFVNKAKNIAMATATGAAVGGPVGAVVMLGASAGREYVASRQVMGSYYRSLNETNYQVGFSRVRAGLVDEGRGTEN